MCPVQFFSRVLQKPKQTFRSGCPKPRPPSFHVLPQWVSRWERTVGDALRRNLLLSSSRMNFTLKTFFFLHAWLTHLGTPLVHTGTLPPACFTSSVWLQLAHRLQILPCLEGGGCRRLYFPQVPRITSALLLLHWSRGWSPDSVGSSPRCHQHPPWCRRPASAETQRNPASLGIWGVSPELLLP